MEMLTKKLCTALAALIVLASLPQVTTAKDDENTISRTREVGIIVEIDTDVIGTSVYKDITAQYSIDQARMDVKTEFVPWMVMAAESRIVKKAIEMLQYREPQAYEYFIVKEVTTGENWIQPPTIIDEYKEKGWSRWTQTGPISFFVTGRYKLRKAVTFKIYERVPK